MTSQRLDHDASRQTRARLQRLVLCATLAAPALQCGSDTTGPAAPPLAIIGSRSVLLAGGDTVHLTLVQPQSSGASVAVMANWTSSNTYIATVDANGLVTSKILGSVTITARAQKQTVNTLMIVVGHPYLLRGEDSVVLHASVFNQLYAPTAEGGHILLSGTWRSDDATIATVDATGMVTGARIGHAYIWATFGPESTSVLARVDPLLGITPTPDTILLGDSLALILRASDAAGNGVSLPAPITWMTSNTPVATISANGIVHTVAPGPALATARFDWTSATASLGVTPPLNTVALSNSIACGLDASSAVWCWVYSTQAVLLGTGSDDSIHNASSPRLIASAPKMLELGGADETGCGLGVDHRAYCWHDLWPASGVSAAVAEGPPGPFTHLAVGYAHRCGWEPGGAVNCWVLDQNVNLGQANDPAPHTFSLLVAAPYHTCGIENGDVYCWGAGGDLRLGSPTTETICGGNLIAPCSSTPLLVPGLPKMVALSGGAEYTCGIAVDESAYCWGSNEYGQLGSGDALGGGSDFAPRLVAGGLHFAQIAAGYWHACGLTTGGDVYCWGEMSDDVGPAITPYTPCADRYVGTRQRCYPVPALVHGIRITGLRASHMQACGIRSDHTAMCWTAGRWQ